MKNSTKGTLLLLVAIVMLYLFAYLINAGSEITNAWWFEATGVITLFAVGGCLFFSIGSFMMGDK